jgi:hypothetical protein
MVQVNALAELEAIGIGPVDRTQSRRRESDSRRFRSVSASLPRKIAGNCTAAARGGAKRAQR